MTGLRSKRILDSDSSSEDESNNIGEKIDNDKGEERVNKAQIEEEDEDEADEPIEQKDGDDEIVAPQEDDEEEDEDDHEAETKADSREDEEDENDTGRQIEDEDNDDEEVVRQQDDEDEEVVERQEEDDEEVRRQEDDDEEVVGRQEEEDENEADEQEEDDDEVEEQKEDEDVEEEEVDRGDNEEEDDDDDDNRRSSQNITIYDFDLMMAKKKEENSRKRKRRNYDIINDNDDIIADIIQQMRDAVAADNEANTNKMAATRKLKLLPFVLGQLRKVDLRDAFLDSDVLGVITEWLAPLPDRSLPHLNIRDSLFKILIDFNLYDVDRIKASGIGKAIMYLYKHPKETRENKQRAKQLISCWSRPIFQLDSSFNSISREEREQRDLELMSKQRRASKQLDDQDSERAGTSSGSKKSKDEAALKPGDKGWIPRARVPAPSMRDYVVRPRSKVDGDVGKSSKRPTNMLEKYMKNQQDRRRANRQQRAINMKLDRD